MGPSDRPLFTSDWPRYAIGAHILFWGLSVIFLATMLVAAFNLISIDVALFMLLPWLASIVLVGLSGVFSGKLYSGWRAFDRSPLTGDAARRSGGFMSISTMLFMAYIYALSGLFR